MTPQEVEAIEMRVMLGMAAVDEVGPVEAARFLWGDRGAQMTAGLKVYHDGHDCDAVGCLDL